MPSSSTCKWRPRSVTSREYTYDDGAAPRGAAVHKLIPLHHKAWQPVVLTVQQLLHRSRGDAGATINKACLVCDRLKCTGPAAAVTPSKSFHSVSLRALAPFFSSPCLNIPGVMFFCRLLYSYRTDDGRLRGEDHRHGGVPADQGKGVVYPRCACSFEKFGFLPMLVMDVHFFSAVFL